MIATLALSALLLGAAPEAPSSPAILLVQETEAPRPAAAPARRQQQRPARRRSARRATPPAIQAPPPPPPTPAPRADIAPMPDRSIEAPRGPFEPETARLRPDLIRPRNLPDARVQSDNEYTRERDSLYREPAAGARMNIPFSY
ncbi:hypothetical protein J8J14_04610 [Roseomonas sp. SSH11]|uniref:Uncharacterized protein n=1 Tax=Pararoseomonas baculiformis TaxID=2820812 RepID=A0ABS4AAM6_9PROT|nr:hypothetical protein [Pararoseomonas baculiformis]MBP0444052.1 hypothetical protein [Pararoseomonas baculiformis]